MNPKYIQKRTLHICLRFPCPQNRLKYSDHALPAAKDVLGVLYKQRYFQNEP